MTAIDVEQQHLRRDLPRRPLTGRPFIETGGRTDIGRKRTTNTDFFLTADLNRSLVLGPSSLDTPAGAPWIGGTQGKLLVVADGISGPGMGRLASATAVDSIAHYITDVLPWIIAAHERDRERLLREIDRGLMQCQARIREEAANNGYEGRPVGTTLTMAFILWPRLYIIHAGDSRAYLCRGHHLRQLTSDDTIAQRLIDHQVLSPERAANVPFRHVLTNAIGGDSDELELEHHHYQLEPGDQLLLCSNGITRKLSNDEIKHHLTNAVTASLCCDRLIDMANERGGDDNATAVVARIARGS